MFSRRRRSYAEAVESRKRLGLRLLVLLLVFFCFQVLSGLFVTAYSIGSKTMAPSLAPGDLVLATPLAFGPDTVFGKLPGIRHPERGDLVLTEPPFASRPGFWPSVFDSLVRFVTFQRFSLLSRGHAAVLAGPSVQRIVGLPGDTIKMKNYVFRVKPAGSEHFFSEFELSTKQYDIVPGKSPSGWIESFPVSGSMSAQTLGKDEYFLAGDARGLSSDSRLWGAVKSDRLLSLVILRYWPPARFGSP